ncbi:MAG TPA: hypothetical protein VGD71_34325, partial [Kribbella sp.]
FGRGRIEGSLALGRRHIPDQDLHGVQSPINRPRRGSGCPVSVCAAEQPGHAQREQGRTASMSRAELALEEPGPADQ